MIYIGNIEILTAKSAIYLGNVGFNLIKKAARAFCEFIIFPSSIGLETGDKRFLFSWAHRLD
ncbi:MAG: hypothetical protein OJF48_004768 [Afipia sp.]|nr:MAG: hypothetical protein OJF48_004768 [Afipia sp.]